MFINMQIVATHSNREHEVTAQNVHSILNQVS